jgi:hypothetical protein
LTILLFASDLGGNISKEFISAKQGAIASIIFLDQDFRQNPRFSTPRFKISEVGLVQDF